MKINRLIFQTALSLLTMIIRAWPRSPSCPRLSRSLTSSSREMSVAKRAMLDKMLRVDHAGEYGADRIYAGQLAVLGKTDVGETIHHMWEQEKVHLATFNKLLPQHRARPTLLLPLWHVAGFALGAGTALLGKEGAMACTVAVEASITEHYNQQIRTLANSDKEDHKELIETITKFRDEEQEHHDIGLEHDAELAPAYQALSGAIKVGCTAAIWLSERI